MTITASNQTIFYIQRAACSMLMQQTYTRMLAEEQTREIRMTNGLFLNGAINAHSALIISIVLNAKCHTITG